MSSYNVKPGISPGARMWVCAILAVEGACALGGFIMYLIMRKGG